MNSPDTESLENDSRHGLASVVVPLMKSVVYREETPALWECLLAQQTHVRSYISILGLELHIDESEGHAFLRSRPDLEEALPGVPRLVARRPLTFPVSLLLALLRKELMANVANGGDARLILTRDAIIDMVRVFMPDGTNEARQLDKFGAQLEHVVKLGFLRRLRDQNDTFEVRRIIKTYVDAQWLAEFDRRLAEYHTQLAGEMNGETNA